MIIKYNIVYILLLLLSISSFIRLNNSYNIIDYSYDGTEKFYTSSSCLLDPYYVLCVETEVNDDCSTLTFNKPEYINGGLNKLMSNDTATYFKFTLYFPIGNDPIIINNDLTLNYQCLELDLNKVSLKLVSPYNLYPVKSTFNVVTIGYYELLGDYDRTASLGNIVGLGGYSLLSPLLLRSNILSFTSDGTIKTDATLTPLLNTIYGSTPKSFSLLPVSDNIFNDVYDIKTYPDLEYLINLDTIGLGQGAILQFTINNTANTPYAINLNGTTTTTPYHPIYGNETSTTYLYPLSNFDVASLYELYYFNNNQYQKSSISIEAKVNKYFTQSLPALTGQVYSSYPSNYPTIAYGFTDTKLYEFPPINVIIGTNTKLTRFPFGYTNGSPSGFKYIINSLVKSTIAGSSTENLQLESTVDRSGVFLSYQYQYEVPFNAEEVPKITDYQLIHLVDELYLFRVDISAPNSLYYIQVQAREIYYGKESLISGDLNTGTYEMVISTIENKEITIVDQFKNSISYSNLIPITLSPNIKLYNGPASIPQFNFSTIENISYLYNDIDVTNHRQYNVLYFNCSTLPKDQGKFAISFNDIQSLSNTIYTHALDKPNYYYARYNESIGLFQVEFYVECNSPINYVMFSIVTNYFALRGPALDSQLRVKKSHLDLQGPIFKDIKKILPSSTLDETNDITEIGWTLSIQDSINGFKSGYVVIKGELDQSYYNISISLDNVKSGGNEFLGDYDLKIQVYYPCISQNYIISEVGLYDKIDRFSYFSTINVPNPNYSGVLNPFIYFLNDTLINKIQLTCSSDPVASADTTPPVLLLITPSKISISVDSPDRELSITFDAQDLESGLKNDTFPIVYLSTTNNRILECVSSIVSMDHQSATYQCTIELPFGFGVDGIILSIYGLINNNGLFTGYSTLDLMDLGLIYSIVAEFVSSKPTILGHYRINEHGGDLWIWGRNLNLNSKAYITFNDGTTDIIDSSSSYSAAVLFKDSKPTDKPFKLYLSIDSLQVETNTITITPTVYDFYIPINPEFIINDSSSSSGSNDSTPLPTNAPQKCQGNPICGGPTHGKCIENKGCLCYSPWFGKDCSSQIIIIDPPIIGDGGDGNTSPTINITVPDNNNNNNNSVVTYSSLISIVALREVNILGNTINYYPFKNDWTSEEIDQFTYNFYNQFNSTKDQITTTTNIIVTLKWFINETTISFANEELSMNPSSLKYTINISSYPFQSKLNELQLVMSALLTSNTTEKVCSSREFGETASGDNSNYIKIQIDNHSLYGRFIRRGIIDSKIKSVQNILLDSNMNPITKTTSIQSYIAIQIPYYEINSILDPDFSVLIDSYSASSICSNNSLSAGKIAGIVLGSVAFLAVIIVGVIYIIKKKQNDKKLISNIQQKINSMNNNNL